MAWPWPLDGVEAWFKSLWNWVSTAACNAVSVVSGWVWSAIYWVRDRVSEGLNWISRVVESSLEWMYTRVSGTFNWLWNTISGAFNTVSSWITNGVTWLWTTVSAALNNLYTFLSNGWTWLGGQISQGLGSLWTAISTGLSNVGSAVWTAVGGLWDSLTGLANDITKAFWAGLNFAAEALLQWFVPKLQWLGQQITGMMDALRAAVAPLFDPLIRVMVDKATSGISPGSPPLEVQQAAEAFSARLVAKMDELVPKERGSPPPLTSLLAAVAGLTGVSMLCVAGMGGIAAALDLAHPVKQTGLLQVSHDLVYQMNFPTVLGQIIFSNIYVGVMVPLKQRWNELYVPEIPGAMDLTRFATERLITVEEYYGNMRFHGYDTAWSSQFLLSSWRVPGFGEMQQMVWRGSITAETLEGGLRAMGTREDFIPGYRALIDQIPGPGDLIRFVVREVISPGDFTQNMALQGYSARWSSAFWEAHWVLPAFANLVDAFHRGVIPESDLSSFLVLHDYTPTPRPGISKSDLEIMRGILKVQIPRVDLRYAWMMGRLSDKELVNKYEKLGYEDDSELMAEIQMLRALTMEVNKVRDEWLQDAIAGYITEETLAANLAEIGIGAARIDYYVAYTKKRRERGYYADLLDFYRDGYMKDLVTEEDLRQHVSEIIVTPEVADLFVEKAYVDKYKKPAPPKATEEDKALEELQKYQVSYAIEAYRKYTVEKDDLIRMLTDAGVDPSVASARADYEETKRPILKPPADVVAAEKEKLRVQKLEEQIAIEKFKRGVIDADALYQQLLNLGLSEELAMAATQLEIVRKIKAPKVG